MLRLSINSQGKGPGRYSCEVKGLLKDFTPLRRDRGIYAAVRVVDGKVGLMLTHSMPSVGRRGNGIKDRTGGAVLSVDGRGNTRINVAANGFADKHVSIRGVDVIRLDDGLFVRLDPSLVRLPGDSARGMFDGWSGRKKVLLVGQRPPGGPASVVLPQGGDELSVRLAAGAFSVGCRCYNWLKSFDLGWDDAINLMHDLPDAAAWPTMTARAAADSLRPLVADRYETVVLLGREVATAFLGGGHRRWFDKVVVGGCTFVVVPHPSGHNHWWNDRENRVEFKEFSGWLTARGM